MGLFSVFLLCCCCCCRALFPFNSFRHTQKISRNEIAISFRIEVYVFFFLSLCLCGVCCVVIYHCCQCADDWMYFVFHSSPFDCVWFDFTLVYFSYVPLCHTHGFASSFPLCLAHTHMHRSTHTHTLIRSHFSLFLTLTLTLTVFCFFSSLYSFSCFCWCDIFYFWTPKNLTKMKLLDDDDDDARCGYGNGHEKSKWMCFFPLCLSLRSLLLLLFWWWWWWCCCGLALQIEWQVI